MRRRMGNCIKFVQPHHVTGRQTPGLSRRRVGLELPRVTHQIRRPRRPQPPLLEKRVRHGARAADERGQAPVLRVLQITRRARPLHGEVRRHPFPHRRRGARRGGLRLHLLAAHAQV